MLLTSILFLLLSNAVTTRRDKSIVYSRVAITILLYSALLALEGLYLTSLERGIGLYGGLFQATSTTQIFHIFIFLVTAVILQLTAFHPRKIWLESYSSITKLLFYNLIYYKTKITNKFAENFKIIEYPLIVLFIVTGAAFLVTTSDLVSIFLSIELQSYGLYLLSTLYRNSELATGAGLTYFLLGGLSSCFILLGSSLLYANSGTTNLDGLYVITSLSDITANYSSLVEQVKASDLSLANTLVTNGEGLSWYKPHYINMSLLILSVGFLFKVSAAPFHFWSPDVYDAIPTIVTTFVAIIAKISIFILLLELVHYTSSSLFTLTEAASSNPAHLLTKGPEFTWKSSLLVSSLFSLLIGTIVGLTQFRIKRLFAYSTISHVGFILLALTINSIESIQAFIFYLMQYSLSNLNAFFILVTMGYIISMYISNKESDKALTDKANSPIQLISQLTGFFYLNPYLALSFAITIFSFVGIPPLIGFFAKQMVLSAALDNGYIFITLVAILTSVISAVYYLNVIKQVFFDKPYYETDNSWKKAETAQFNISPISLKLSNKSSLLEKESSNLFVAQITLSSSLTITISVLSLVTALFMFMPQQWLSMANILALLMFNP